MEHLKLKTLSCQVFLDLQFCSQTKKQQLPEAVKDNELTSAKIRHNMTYCYYTRNTSTGIHNGNEAHMEIPEGTQHFSSGFEMMLAQKTKIR
jgi:hypothetical protein